MLKEDSLSIHFIRHTPKLNKWDNLTNMGYSSSVLRRYLKKLKPDLCTAWNRVRLCCGDQQLSECHHGTRRHEGKCSEGSTASGIGGLAIYKHEPLALEAARHLISINPYVEQQFPEYRGEVYRIENPISPDFFKVRGKDNTDLVFVGKMNERKRVLNLLEACRTLVKSLPDLSVRLVGGGDPGYLDRIHDFIRYGLGRNVGTDHCPRRRYAAIADAKVLVSPPSKRPHRW